MGIYDQPNSWQCGPFALKHALLAHGVFVHEDEITRVAGTTEQEGTDDAQLTRAAQAFGAVLRVQRFHTAWGARRALMRQLADHTPVLLCVDQWDHWVTALGADAEHVVIMDSHYDTVVRLEPWGPFLRRIAYWHRIARWLPRIAWYDLHPLAVRGETGLRLALTPPRARQLLAAPAAVRTSLDRYAQTLAPYAARNGRASGAVALAPWLQERQPELADRLSSEVRKSFMLAADLFDVHCDARGLREVSRVVAGSADRPVAPPTQAPDRSRVLAAAS